MGMKRVVLSLGTNLGDKLYNLNRCNEVLENRVGRVIKKSSVYESKSWGFESFNFFNMNIVIETEHELEAFFNITQELEKELGREGKTSGNYEARIIDIDILFFDSLKINSPKLIIPHKELTKRKFVLVPLKELYPEFVLPNNKHIDELISECQDKSELNVVKT